MNRKNSFARLLSAGLLLSAALATAQAQVQFTVNNIAGDSDVLPVNASSLLIGAFSTTQGGTVNGVTFTAFTPSGTSTLLNSDITLSGSSGMGAASLGVQSGGGAFAALPSDYQTILNNSTYSNSSSAPLAVTLSNLTVGATYTANFWFQYADGFYGKDATVTLGSTSSGTAYWNNTYSGLNDSSAYQNGAGQFITATFTAGSTTEAFDVTAMNSSGSAITPIISALEVVESVPEPSTVALMTGAIGLFALLSVRRLCLAAA